MSVFIQSYPNNYQYPIPVENGVRFSFLSDDYPTFFGENPTAYISFTDDVLAPEGTVFHLLGQEFTISNTIFTHNSFNVNVLNAFYKAYAFREMLKSNFFFRNFNITMYSQSGATVVTIESPEIGQYSGEGEWSFDFTNFTTEPTKIVSPGNQSGFKENYKIVYDLYLKIDDVYQTIFSIPQSGSLAVQKGTDLPIAIAVDFGVELSKHVWTTIPQLNDNNFYDENIGKDFIVGYGELWDAENCGVETGQWKKSTSFSVYNGALSPDDFLGNRRYFYSSQNKFEVNFLSLMPNKYCVCYEDKFWLWAHVVGSRLVVGQSFEFRATFRFYNNNSLIDTQVVPVGETGREGYLVIGAGIANGLFEPPDDFNCYSVQIHAITVEGNGELYERPVQNSLVRTVANDFRTEEKFFSVSRTCCTDAPIYFLSPAGGYDIMTGIQIVSMEIETEMEEICRNIPTGGTSKSNEFELLESGKFLVGGKTYEKMTYETPLYQKTEEQMEYFKSFKSSERRFIVRKNKDGVEYRKSIIVEPGTCQIWEKDAKIKITFVAYFSLERKNQSSR